MENEPVINSYLRHMLDIGGSDLHLSVGYPPKARIHGNMQVLEDEVLTPERLYAIMQEICYPPQRWDTYLAEHDLVMTIIGPVHGFAYMVYLVFAFDLAMKCRWSIKGTVLVLLAGTVPFLSFIAERSATKDVRAKLAAEETRASTTGASARVEH